MDVIPDETYNDALVIVCDTANEERVCDQRYKLGKKLLKLIIIQMKIRMVTFYG